jgi:hypothetical protein
MNDHSFIYVAFRRGGFGMFPTAFFGVLLIAAAVLYALRPEKRFVPLQISLGILTMTAGALGFVTGLIKSCEAISQVPAKDHFITIIGLGESLNNIGLALACVVFAALAACVGTIRIARRATA